MQVWFDFARVTSRREERVDRNDKTNDDSLERFAVAKNEREEVLKYHNPENQTAKHHFGKAQKNNLQGVQQDGKTYAD